MSCGRARAQSGLRRLLVGVESGSDEMLKRIRKDIRIEQVFQTAHKMAAHGIAGHFPFIVGFPEESDDSIRATIDVAKRLRAISARVPARRSSTSSPIRGARS